jgi:hypothetical protein
LTLTLAARMLEVIRSGKITRHFDWKAGLAGTKAPIRPAEQSRVRVQVPPGRVPVPVGLDAVAAADHWGTTTSSIDPPAPAAPSAPSWGEISVEFAAAAAP